MSGGTYKYDLADLTAVAGGLGTLAADFENASDHREDADGALGYADLRGAVRDFVDNWDHERGQQLEAIHGSATALVEIVENYVEYDERATADLRAGSAG